MNNWHIREPHGAVHRDKYEFDTSAWDILETEGPIFVLAVTNDIGMEPKAISAELEQLLSQVNTSLQRHGSPESSYKPYFKERSARAIDGGEEGFKKLARDIESPWYWDGAFLLIEAAATDAKILVQPESDGTEIALYLSGTQSEQIYGDLLAVLRQD